MQSRKISLVVAVLCLAVLATAFAFPAAAAKAPPVSSPAPVETKRLTKLRFTIDTTSDWATIDLFGGSIYQQGTPVVTGGPGGQYSSTGYFLQTATTARLVVDVVYQLPKTPLELRVCKNNEGVTSVRVERITDAPELIATIDNTRVDGVWVNGCADRADKALTADQLAPSYSWPRPVDKRRLALAVYTPWYSPSSFLSHPFVDRPLDPYDGSTQAGVTGMVNQAADAGVNGFMYWYNGEPEAERRYDLVMRAAESRPGFTVAAQLDLGALGGFTRGTVDAAGIERWTRTLLARASSPSYLRVGQRPVLFVWGTQWLPLTAWRQAINAIKASGLNPFIVADGVDPRFKFDGFWVLNANNVADAGLPAWYEHWNRAARFSADRKLGNKPMLWAAGISPGEDDTFADKVPGTGWFIPRNSGSRYDRVWQAAGSTAPDWMIISSWNDFHEATYVQPSVKLGTRALDQTTAWARWFARR